MIKKLLAEDSERGDVDVRAAVLTTGARQLARGWIARRGLARRRLALGWIALRRLARRRLALRRLALGWTAGCGLAALACGDSSAVAAISAAAGAGRGPSRDASAGTAAVAGASSAGTNAPTNDGPAAGRSSAADGGGGGGRTDTHGSAANGGEGGPAGNDAGAPVANGGRMAPADATATVPTQSNGHYIIQLADTRLSIDPMTGARITEFSLGGHNLLTGPDVDPDNWGATFWPSPQARWNWPPVPEIDTQPYSATIAADSVELTSAPGVRARVQVVKHIRALNPEAAVECTYVLTNIDTSPVSWSPWEISRVAPGGISFFPTGSNTVTNALSVQNSNGITWYQHDPSSVAMGGQKLTADGSEGWLAHLSGNLLFVKQFDDVPVTEQAPAPEAEIGIYAAPNYVELEPQGPYTQLAPGASITWVVRWYVRQLPADIAPTLGNAALVTFVRGLIAK
jgi:hypothetical protein